MRSVTCFPSRHPSTGHRRPIQSIECNLSSTTHYSRAYHPPANRGRQLRAVVSVPRPGPIIYRRTDAPQRFQCSICLPMVKLPRFQPSDRNSRSSRRPTTTVIRSSVDGSVAIIKNTREYIKTNNMLEGLRVLTGAEVYWNDN